VPSDHPITLETRCNGGETFRTRAAGSPEIIRTVINSFIAPKTDCSDSDLAPAENEKQEEEKRRRPQSGARRRSEGLLRYAIGSFAIGALFGIHAQAHLLFERSAEKAAH